MDKNNIQYKKLYKSISLPNIKSIFNVNNIDNIDNIYNKNILNYRQDLMYKELLYENITLTRNVNKLTSKLDILQEYIYELKKNNNTLIIKNTIL